MDCDPQVQSYPQQPLDNLQQPQDNQQRPQNNVQQPHDYHQQQQQYQDYQHQQYQDYQQQQQQYQDYQQQPQPQPQQQQQQQYQDYQQPQHQDYQQAQHQDYQQTQHQDYQQQLPEYQQQAPVQSYHPYNPSQAQPAYDNDPSSQAYYSNYQQGYQNPASKPYPQQQQYLHQNQQQQPYPAYYPPGHGVPPASYQQPLQNDPGSVPYQAAASFQPPSEVPQVADGYPAAGQPPQNVYYAPELQPPPAQAQARPRPRPQGQGQSQSHQQPYPQPQSHPHPRPQPQPELRPLHHQAAGYDVPPGLSPAAAAAVAALSQLNQFAGKMEAAERAMSERQWQENRGKFGYINAPPQPYPHPPFNLGPPVMRPQYHGGGRRGGGRFRGGRSSFGQQTKPDIRAPPSQGRSHMGRSGGRRFPYSAPFGASPHLESASTIRSSSLPPQALERKRRAPPVAWCDICQVDCNTQEVLDQHRNGKRHQKNLERFQKFGKPVSDSQPKHMEQLENELEGKEENVCPSETSAPETVPDVAAAESMPNASMMENMTEGPVVENVTSDAAFDENETKVEQQDQSGNGGFIGVETSHVADDQRSFNPQDGNQFPDSQYSEITPEPQAQQDPAENGTAEFKVAEPEAARGATRDPTSVVGTTEGNGLTMKDANSESKPNIAFGVSSPASEISSINCVIPLGSDARRDEGSISTELSTDT